MTDKEELGANVNFPAKEAAADFPFKALPAPATPQVFMDLDEFNTTVDRQGHRFIWQQAIPCPCRFSTQTDQPDPTCSNCKGAGFDFVNAQPIRGIFAEITANYDSLDEIGQWLMGHGVLTTRPEHPIGYRDRLTMVDAAIDYWEILERKDVTTPFFRCRYRITGRLKTFIDIDADLTSTESPDVCAPHDQMFAPNDPIHNEIERVAALLVWKNETDSVTRLSEGADFSVTEDGLLDFTNADIKETSPGPGDRFSIKYNFAPAWVVDEMRPQYFRLYRDNKLPRSASELVPYPRSVMCKLDYLINPNDE